MSRHLDVSCDRCGVVARYDIALWSGRWELDMGRKDLCPFCASISDDHEETTS